MSRSRSRQTQRPSTLRDERGLAIGAVVWVLMICSVMFATIATVAIRGLRASTTERNSKLAVSAVDAGLQAAQFRLNAVGPTPGQCVVEGSNNLLVEGGTAADGWCPSHEEKIGDGARFAVRTSSGIEGHLPCSSQQVRKVVATGMSGWDGARWTKQRRAAITTSTNSGSVFGSCAIISWQRLTLNHQPYVRGDLATNGGLTTNGQARICGTAHGDNLDNGAGDVFQCGGFEQNSGPTATPYKLRKVAETCAPNKPWADALCNDNERITSASPVLPNATNADPSSAANASQIVWDPATRDLTLSGKATLTLTGNAYAFCRLRVLDDAKLIVSPRLASKPVRIVMDKPENCPGQPASRSLFFKLGGKGTIVNRNPDPTSLQIYMIGTFDPNRSYGTRAVLDGDSNWQQNTTSGAEGQDTYMNMVFYAPRSRVSLQGATRILGAVAAKRVTVSGSGSGTRVIWSNDVLKLNDSNFAVTPTYQRDDWTECAPPTVTEGLFAYVQGCP